MFSPYKYKIDGAYASFQAYFNIEDYVELNNYPGIDMDHLPYNSIYIR